MNSKIVNSVICISESQKNPKRYENLSMCKQYAKEFRVKSRSKYYHYI